MTASPLPGAVPTDAGSGNNGSSDVELIRRLTHEYAANLDGGRLEDLLSLFTDDGTWDGSGWGIPAISGTAALREFFAATMGSNAGTVHLTLNHIISVDGDTAAGTAYFHAFGRRPDGSLTDSLGIYTDEFVRTAQGWKIGRRSVTGLLAEPSPADTSPAGA